MEKKMTNNQKIWETLSNKKPTTIEKISNKLSISEDVVALYVRALYNAKYLTVDTPHTKIKHNHKIQLVKYTGEKAPLYNKKGIFTDVNVNIELAITSRGVEEKQHKNHVNLIPILKAIISLNKEEIYKKDIWEEAELESVMLIRWIPRLIEAKILIPTGESYRNSPLYLVNMEKCKQLLKYVEQFKSHKLAFEKVKE